MEINETWQAIGDRLIEIENDNSLPPDHPGLSGLKTTLAFDYIYRKLATRNLPEIRQQLTDMGFNSQASLAEFREYWKANRETFHGTGKRGRLWNT